MSNYAGPSSHYPDDLPSDSEPGKIYDGMQDHSRVRSYGSKFDNYLASKPMRYGNGLSISDTKSSISFSVFSFSKRFSSFSA